MEILLLTAAIVGVIVYRRRQHSDRPKATNWEKGVASDLLDQLALDEARAAVRNKLQTATSDDVAPAATAQRRR